MIYGSNIFVLQMKAFQRITWSCFDNLYIIVFASVFNNVLGLEKTEEMIQCIELMIG